MSENLEHQEPAAADETSTPVEGQQDQNIQLPLEPQGAETHEAAPAGASPRVARSASNQAAQSQPARNEAAAPNRPAQRGTSRSGKKRRHTPRARRMNLSITRLDAWSVAKVSFMLSVAGGIIQIVAVGLLWGVLQVVGVFDDITQIFSSAGLDAGSIDLTNIFSLSTVLSAVTILSVVEVVLFTLLLTILSLLYNVVSTLVGGVHVTLGDD